MARLVALLCLLAMAVGPVHAQTAAYVAPPRTIADITAILDQKLDPEKVSKILSDVDAVPPAGAGRAALATFYYDRGQARLHLGRVREALTDAEKALEVGQGQVDPRQLNVLHQFVAIVYGSAGDPGKALQQYLQIERDAKRLNLQGAFFNAYKGIVKTLIAMGDFNQAETYVRKSEALMQQAHSWPNFAEGHWNWEKDLETSRGDILQARGRFREAEEAYHRAEEGARQWVILGPKLPYSPPRIQLQDVVDQAIRAQGMMKARQGRMAEGEADVRRALLDKLKDSDKYHAQTTGYIRPLATLLVEQGRYGEAEKLTRVQIEIQNAIGFAKDSQQFVGALSDLASILNLQGRWAEAAQVYDQLDQATAKWESARKDAITLNSTHISTMYNTNNLSAGVEAANRLLARQKERFGEQHVETAFAHGTLAIGLSLSGRDDDALREFKVAIPILVSAMRNAEASTDTDDTNDAAVRAQRTQIVIETYMRTLARVGGGDAALETFGLADLMRGRSVQRALAASSARAAVGNPALGDLVRKEQDLGKQIGAQLGLLNNVLATPPEQRDDKIVRDVGTDIEKLRAARTSARQEIARRFPRYAELIDPKPPSVDDIKATLRPDEALLSFYFGIQSSFVWAVPKDGAVVFAVIPARAGDVDLKVRKLRKALEPEAATIDQIPPFDLALAHELYALLLQPVEAGWKPAKNLIMVTNGLLGELPLSLLPTAPARVDADAGSAPLFAGYRDVPWLARSHAITVMPSASALITLRRLSPSSPKREKLIGFGDPYFNEQQAAEAEHAEPKKTLELASASAETGAAVATRGLSLNLRASPRTEDIDSADLAMLPRLPDTRAELIAMARALGADPTKTLYLGRDANEHNVESINLSQFRIVAFATHGLVPGDLNGLTQPALALTAPKLAGVEGDGLLTMEKILRLKLDADWVVLSACNTAAGAGAGAEAVSGLGRAFFYAGTRALLVTNWSVHSASARELIADLFRQQSANPGLGRGEALRQAMMSMVDGPGFVDGSGKTLFAYAHPLFWAPYSVIGEGGAN